MSNIRKFFIALFILPSIAYSQGYSVQSIQKINNKVGGLDSTTLLSQDRFGGAVEVIGDVNHDGIDDIAVGAYLDDDGVASNQGAVYILMLNADGTVKSQQKISSTSGNGPSLINGHFYFGSSIAALGDLNGDGNVDIAVGCYGGGDENIGGYRGAVYILFLDDDGTVLEYEKISNNEGGGPGTLINYDYFGRSVATIGDINGDGIPDIAIQTSGDDDGGSNTGAVYIGFLDYCGTLKSIQKISDSSGSFSGDLDAGDGFGSAAPLGDLNGDGVNDIAIGASSDDDGGTGRGAVWICFMNADGTVDSEQKISDNLGGFTGVLDDGDGFGGSLVSVGDLDGDGVIDLVVGASGDDDGGGGAFWILYLNADGTVKAHDKIAADDAQLINEVVTNDKFMSDISFFGDRNNDGKIDFLIGAYNAHVPDYGSRTGEVYVAHLEGVATYPNKQYHETTVSITAMVKHSALAGEPLENELDASDYYGQSVAGIGDLDGDGIADLVVGAYADDDGGAERGAVYIQLLNADGSTKSYQKISDTAGSFTGTLDNSDSFGVSVTEIGDLDNDGVFDIVVGAHLDDDGGTNRGAVWVLFLDTNGTVKSYQKISDTAGSFTGTLDNSDYFGRSVAAIGDVNGDGINDLAVGAHADDDGGTNRGAIWILFLDTDGTVKWHQKISDTSGDFSTTLGNSDYFGANVSSFGDMDGDNIPDIVVSAHLDDDGGTNRGAIYILNLTDSGKVKSEYKISNTSGDFNAYLKDSDQFGTSIEGGYDLNQDGVNDILVGASSNDNGGTNKGMLWMLFMNANGTVNYHRNISATSNKLLSQLDNNDYLAFSASVVDYNTQNNTAKIAVSARKDDDGASNTGAVYILSMDLTATYNPSPSAASTHRSTTDLGYNWSYGESYDENGNILSASKQYVDALGRKTQTISKNIDKNRALTAQTIYDKYGRAVIKTLPAPVGQNIIYKPNFTTDMDGNVYGYTNFDLTNTLNNPDSISNTLPNSLGDYYSDNGEDAYMATSSYPYSRVEYMADPTGRVKRSAAPGKNFKMGSGHENKVYFMFTGGELDRAFGVDSSFYCETDTTNRLLSKAISNTEIVAQKTISVDAEGKIAITFVSDGLTVATCVSGMTPTPSVPEQNATNTMLFAGTQSVDIHLPEAKSTTLKLPLPTYWNGESTVSVLVSDISFSIMDLDSNIVLDSGTAYTINTSTRYVTFTGTNKHRFLRISYSYTPSIIAYWETNSITPPDADVEYKLDYSHFTANYYDLAGRLRMNVSPKGFNYAVNGEHTEFSRYDYNPYGQLIAQETPDEGLTEYLYSNEGVVRFSQNAQQRTDNKFSYVLYDEYNRSIESGEYDESGAVFEFANYYTAAVSGTDVKDTINIVGFDFDDSYCSDQKYIAYDMLASADEIPSAYSYDSQYPQHNLKGRVSKTWNAYNKTWYSYDYAGRSEYIVQELVDTDFSSTKDSTIKTVEYTYAPVTSVLLQEEYQKNKANEKLTTDYTYNSNQQLVTAIAKNNAGDTLGQAAFEYNVVGQLTRKELGGTLQGIDYVYTLNGQLKSMNHPSLYEAYDPGQDGKTGSGNANFEADLFGYALDYYEDDYSRTGSNITSSVNTSSSTGYNNGLIQAVRWRIKDENEIGAASPVTLYTEASTDEELMYEFSYDDFYRFETAVFGVFDNDTASSAFTDRTDYKVYGASTNTGVDYDIIGNITDLKRNGYAGATPGLLMDDLDYTYNSGTSKLATIEDASTSTYATDFETSGAASFTYNNMGQMIASVADSVDTLNYYPNGQVQQVIFSNGNSADYYYNERGIKIKSKFTDVQGTTTIKTNWYITDASGAIRSVHEKIDANPISMTGQVIYAGGRLGIYDVVNQQLNYELTDHLGNVRVTFKDTSSTATPVIEVTSWADYYPFGEVLPGRNSNPTDHLFGYQGQEKVGNGSKWYNFNLRMYNPALGRFNTIDPYSQFNSPYLAMANNPISFVDPDGGRALLTEAQQNRLLRKLWFRGARGETSSLDFLRNWEAITGGNHYQGLSLEEAYSLGRQFGVGAMYGYIGGYGGIFDNETPGAGAAQKSSGFELSEEILGAAGGKGELGGMSNLFWTWANNNVTLGAADLITEEFGSAFNGGIGYYKKQVGAEKSENDPITSVFLYNNDGTKTMLWDITDGDNEWQADYNSTPLVYKDKFDTYQWNGHQEEISKKSLGDDINDLWNSDIARAFIPDAISLGGNLTFIPFYGVSTTTEVVLPLRGADMFRPKVFVTPAEGTGLNAGVGVEFTEYKFDGPLKDFNHSSFLGTTKSIEIDAGPFSVGGSWSPGEHGSLSGGTVGLGIGGGISWTWGDPFNP
jgi:RHS repeat-associated protein